MKIISELTPLADKAYQLATSSPSKDTPGLTEPLIELLQRLDFNIRQKSVFVDDLETALPIGMKTHIAEQQQLIREIEEILLPYRRLIRKLDGLIAETNSRVSFAKQYQDLGTEAVKVESHIGALEMMVLSLSQALATEQPVQSETTPS